MTAVLCALMLGGLGACSEPEPEPIDGGNTRRTDPDAPKEIASKDIADYDASFTVFTRWSDADREDNAFRFRIHRNDDGVLTAYEEIRGISRPADQILLTSLQEIIDRHDLVRLNGLYDVTAGLPPEYQPGGLTVVYASEEKLTFTTDNNPYALWTEETYDVFASWFAEKGDASLYPPEEGRIQRLSRVTYEFNGLEYSYGIREAEGKPVMERTVYDPENRREVSAETAGLPDDFYGRITEILEKYSIRRLYDFSAYNHEANNFSSHDLGFYGMGGRPDYNEPDSADTALYLHVQYENGSRMNIDTRKASEIAGMQDMLDELFGYFDSLF